jgi:hypothetical protein
MKAYFYCYGRKPYLYWNSKKHRFKLSLNKVDNVDYCNGYVCAVADMPFHSPLKDGRELCCVADVSDDVWIPIDAFFNAHGRLRYPPRYYTRVSGRLTFDHSTIENIGYDNIIIPVSPEKLCSLLNNKCGSLIIGKSIPNCVRNKEYKVLIYNNEEIPELLISKDGNIYYSRNLAKLTTHSEERRAGKVAFAAIGGKLKRIQVYKAYKESFNNGK